MAWLVNPHVDKGWIQLMFILVVKKIDMFDGSGFDLTELIIRNCFEAILTALSYVDHDLPVLLDQFWEV